jgi:hypothetical protein
MSPSATRSWHADERAVHEQRCAVSTLQLERLLEGAQRLGVLARREERPAQRLEGERSLDRLTELVPERDRSLEPLTGLGRPAEPARDRPGPGQGTCAVPRVAVGRERLVEPLGALGEARVEVEEPAERAGELEVARVVELVERCA